MASWGSNVGEEAGEAAAVWSSTDVKGELFDVRKACHSTGQTAVRSQSRRIRQTILTGIMLELRPS
jgi:hypothetical protein